MNTLGYKQWKEYFSERATNDQQSAIEQKIIQQWKYDEHAYARRQMTWFRKMSRIAWFDSTDPTLEAKVTTKVAAWYTQKEVL